jgi:hypothetical protein
MTKIKFGLPISMSYTQGALKTSQQLVVVEINLMDGEHLFVSAPIEIGNYSHYKVFAHISIPYSYDIETQYITIAGADDIGDRQISIHTSLEQQEKTTEIHYLNDIGNPKNYPNLWSDFMNKNTEVRQVKKMVIRQAIETITESLLKSAGVQGVVQTGIAPIITPQNYADYKAMFKPEKADVPQPSLDDIIEIQGIVNSVFGGTVTWTLNYSFANVDGSTNDPYPPGYNSWIKLWKDKCNNGNDTDTCSSHNYADGKTPYPCNNNGATNIYGGHVIPGTVVKKVDAGKTVYIFPICNKHNNDDSVYMSMRYNPKGVQLNKYNQKGFDFENQSFIN